MMKILLYKTGIDVDHRVDICINGLEALETIKKSYPHDIQYQLIFMDFSMPVMNGIEATKKIREFY